MFALLYLHLCNTRNLDTLTIFNILTVRIIILQHYQPAVPTGIDPTIKKHKTQQKFTLYYAIASHPPSPLVLTTNQQHTGLNEKTEYDDE